MLKWKKYSGVLLPDIPPDQELEDSDKAQIPILIRRNKAMLARYTTDFDCGWPTEWWYCIKDDPMDIEKLRAKERGIIRKGLSFVDIIKMDPMVWKNEIYAVLQGCYQEYPKAYRPVLNRESLYEKLSDQSQDSAVEYWGCIGKEDGMLWGFAVCILKEKYVELSTVKVLPQYLSKQTNAALGYTVCVEYLNKRKYAYICDGERNIRHKTNYQDYLIKYFGFRRAYCKLNIVYSRYMRICISCLYPFKSLIKKFEKISLLYNVSCILKQEWMRRMCIHQENTKAESEIGD